VIYDRASTSGQKGNWSRDDAIRVGAELAERHGYTHELRQEVKSGEELANRPVMRETLEDITDGKVQAVIVQDFTRLSRDEDGIDGKIIRRVCRDNDCKVITPHKVYDFSLDADDDMADFEFLVGKIHKRQTVKALVRGMKEKARQGKQLVGPTLFGYRRVYELREDDPGKRPIGHLEIDESEAEVVRLLFAKYLELGSGRAAAHWLNENGHWKTVKSQRMREKHGLGETKPWRGDSVTRTIQNPLYAGWATWGKECTSRHLRDFEAEWHYRPELQIVGQDTWDRANDQRKRNRTMPPRAATTEYAFSLLLKCSCCGGGMSGTSKRTPTGRHKKYRCRQGDRSGPVACDSPQQINETVTARALIPLTADLIERGLNLKAAMQEAAQDMSQSVDEVMEQAWRAELAEIERQTRNLVSAIAKGVIAEDQARETNQELSEKKARLERNLTKIQEKAEIQQELLDCVQLIEGDVEKVLWLLLEEQPRTLNQIMCLIFKRRSIVVESWGANSHRQSRVVGYELTDEFADIAGSSLAEAGDDGSDSGQDGGQRVPMEEHSTPSWTFLERE
jgi:DNA invertase Pin-like site-specific DNA recombinase